MSLPADICPWANSLRRPSLPPSEPCQARIPAPEVSSAAIVANTPAA